MKHTFQFLMFQNVSQLKYGSFSIQQKIHAKTQKIHKWVKSTLLIGAEATISLFTILNYPTMVRDVIAYEINSDLKNKKRQTAINFGIKII